MARCPPWNLCTSLCACVTPQHPCAVLSPQHTHPHLPSALGIAKSARETCFKEQQGKKKKRKVYQPLELLLMSSPAAHIPRCRDHSSSCGFGAEHLQSSARGWSLSLPSKEMILNSKLQLSTIFQKTLCMSVSASATKCRLGTARATGRYRTQGHPCSCSQPLGTQMPSPEHVTQCRGAGTSLCLPGLHTHQSPPALVSPVVQRDISMAQHKATCTMTKTGPLLRGACELFAVPPGHSPFQAPHH